MCTFFMDNYTIDILILDHTHSLNSGITLSVPVRPELSATDICSLPTKEDMSLSSYIKMFACHPVLICKWEQLWLGVPLRPYMGMPRRRCLYHYIYIYSTNEVVMRLGWEFRRPRCGVVFCWWRPEFWGILFYWGRRYFWIILASSLFHLWKL